MAIEVVHDAAGDRVQFLVQPAAEAPGAATAQSSLAAAVAGRLIELQGGELTDATAAGVRLRRGVAGGELTGMTASYEPHLLVVDDDPLIREELESLFATHPYHVECVASVDRRHADPVRARVCARPGRRAHRRRRRHRPHQGHPRALAGRRRDHDHRLRQHQERRRGDAAGRGRLHHQAVPARGAPARDAEGARAPPPDRRDRVPAPAALRSLRLRQHGQPQRRRCWRSSPPSRCWRATTSRC